MKVLLFDPATGGHHLEYASHIARYLCEHGDEVTFAGSVRPPSPIDSWTVDAFGQVRYLTNSRVSRRIGGAMLPLRFGLGVLGCLRLALREHVDVVHFLYLDRSEIAVLASLSGRTRRPAIFGTLFWPYFVHEGHEPVGIGTRLFHRASRVALGQLLTRGKLDALFVHSERIRSTLLAEYSVPSLALRIQVVPDPAKEVPPISKDRARADLGLSERTPVILFFGGTRYDKGPDVLLQALRSLEGEWIAILAGEADIVGEEQANACRRILRQPKRLVTRFEYVPESDADRYFRAADVIVLPYRRTFKGTSGVLQRAAASGKPVIVSDVGDVGPTVKRARLGTVIPAESPEYLAAALREFLGRREQVEREVEPRALEYANENNWRLLGKATRGRYLSALEPE